MKKALLATPLMALFLTACSKTMEDTTCYVDIADPENITAIIKSDITDGALLEGAKFKYYGNGNMTTEDIKHNLTFDVSHLYLIFNNQHCGVSSIDNDYYKYPMELVGGEFPEPAVAPE